jgi:alpha-methylacyl-CoA racemase
VSAPLAGLTILDLTRLLPGPAATMHLADYGADVIKIEDIGDGDYLRDFPPLIGPEGDRGVNPVFSAVNRGKRSVAINLKTDPGRDLLLRLVDRADALIEGFRPGVLERLGCGWETLHARNPKLVVCSLTGYGQTGPLANDAGHDLNYLAVAGVLDQIRANGQPAIPNLQIGDLLGGALAALSALLIALVGAQRSGIGSRIDVAMTDALLAHHFFPHADHDAGQDSRAEHTLLTGGVACYRVYRTADGGDLAVGALELKFWQAFCDAAQLPQLRERHWSLGEAPGSVAARETIEIVAAHIARRPLPAWLAAVEGVDACVTPVLTPAAALGHPHAVARGLVHQDAHGTRVGPLAQMLPASDLDRAAPRHGQHTRELLAQLGCGTAELDRLVATAVVKADA